MKKKIECYCKDGSDNLGNVKVLKRFNVVTWDDI